MDVNNNIVDDFFDDYDVCNEELTEENICHILRDITLKWPSDAEIILQEIEKFSDSVIQGEEAVDEGEDEYPFLFQVWYGDIYDSSEISGLIELKTDLLNQLQKITEDSLIKKAKTMIDIQQK